MISSEIEPFTFGFIFYILALQSHQIFSVLIFPSIFCTFHKFKKEELLAMKKQNFFTRQSIFIVPTNRIDSSNKHFSAYFYFSLLLYKNMAGYVVRVHSIHSTIKNK